MAGISELVQLPSQQTDHGNKSSEIEGIENLSLPESGATSVGNKYIEVTPVVASNKGKAPTEEVLHTPDLLGTSSHGDNPFFYPVDEVVNLHSIAYDKRNNLIVKRTTRKKS